MSDAPEIVPEPIRFTQATVLLAESWPQYTAITDDFLLRHAHRQKATFDPDADTVTFAVDNGMAVYRIRRDLPKQGRAWVAERVEGDTPGRLRQRAVKYGLGAP